MPLIFSMQNPNGSCERRRGQTLAAHHLSCAIVGLIDPAHAARRVELVAKGAVIARRYAYENILPKWQAFLTGSEALLPSATPSPAIPQHT